MDYLVRKKKCSKCNIRKNKSEFYTDRRNKDKLTGYCRQCVNKRISERRRENPEQFRKRAKLWRENNPDLKRESDLKYSKSEKGKLVKKKIRDRWIINNPIKNILAKRRWRNNNKDKVKQEYEKNKEQYFVRSRNRKAKLKNAEGFHTLKEWEDQIHKKLTVDHIISLDKNGSNYISNIQPLCFSCNVKKGTNLEK